MLESLVASILNRVLGSYVENFDPKQLQIGLLSGDVKLGGLKLKQGALDQLQLPINVVDGHIGSLILQIPYSNLKSKPVKVFIEDVFLVATPDNGIDEKAQARRDMAAKIEKLQLWELSSERAISRSSPGSAADVSEQEKQQQQQQQNFTSSLVTKIVENLQVTIRNIHIRLEDSETGVAMGATLGELSAVSTNKDWEPAFIADIGATTHKLATLDSLAFYIDAELATEFASPRSFRDRQQLLDEFKALISDSVGATDVLRPINGQGFITMNKNPDSELTPKVHADLKFEELSINIDREQYVDTLRLVDRFQKFLQKLKYRRQKPRVAVKEDPMAWFRYAANTVRDRIHEKHRRWTWDYMRQRLDDQRAYVSVYKKWYHAGGNASGLSSAEKATFDRIQSEYTYEDVVFFRSLAKKDLVAERATRSETASANKGSSQSWSEWLWGSKPNGEQTVKADAVDTDARLEITEEQRRELLDVLDVSDFSQDSASQILLSLQFSLRSAGVRLKSAGQALASAGFEGVKTTFVNRPNSFITEMSVDKFAVSDLTHKNKFSDVIHVHNPDQNAQTVPFFWFLFEHHPADRKADSALFVRSQSVVLVHNAQLMESIIEFFSVPPDQGDTVDAILLAANKTVEELREQTRIGFEYALENHKTLNLQLDIKAPTIVIPLDPGADDSPVALLDVGSLQMASDLVPQSVLNEVKSKQALQYTSEDWKRLESLMYDRFTIELHDTQVLLAQSMTDIETARSQRSSKYHFLDKTTLQFLLELSIVPTNRSLTRCRISIKLPNLRATLADVQYILFMKILASVTPKADSDTDTIAGSSLSESQSSLEDKVKVSQDDESTVHSLEVEQRQESPNPGSIQKTFEFVFIVNEVRFLVVRGWDSTPLVDMCLHDFHISCWSLSHQSNESLAVDMTVRDLLITDHTSTSSPMDLRKIAESDGHLNDTKSESNLFSVNFRRATSGDMWVKVNLEAMRFTLNPDTVLAIYDYVMSTFTSPEADTSRDSSPNRNESAAKTPAQITDDTADPALPSARSSKIEVELNMNRVSALLTDDHMAIVTMSLEWATMSVTLTDFLKMQLRLGLLSIVDTNDVPVLSIEEGNDLADFRYETLPMLEDGITPSGPASVYLRMSRVKLAILEVPLTKLVGFLMRFTAMKAVYDQSRMMAFNQALQVEPGMFKFDIVISTPLIEWYQESNWIKINLGELFLQNEFEGTENTVKSGIRHIQFTTSLADSEQEVVPSTDLVVKLVYTPDSKRQDLPVTAVDANLSPIHVEASELQYRFIMQFLDALSRISAGTASARPGLEEVGQFRRQLAKEKHIEENKASYWWGENLSLSLGGEKNDKVTSRPQLRLEFVAPSFDITLNFESKPLASFAIKDVAVEIDIDNKSGIDSNFHVRYFSAEDLTGSEQNKFPTIIPPIKHDGYQVMGRILRREGRALNIECSIDSPQVIVALEYMMLLRKYLEFGNLKNEDEATDSNASSGISDSDSESDAESVYSRIESDQTSTDSQSVVISERSVNNKRATRSLIPVISVNIVDMYLTVLSDEQDEDSEAIVFKIEQLILNTGETSSFTLSKVGMFLTRMRTFEASRLRILDDFSVTASIDNSESTENLRLANIQANMERLVIRISLREIGLILSIVSKASAICSSGSGPSKKSQRKVDIQHNKKATNFFADDHRVARPRRRSGIEAANDESNDSLGLVHESIVSARVLSEQLTAQFEDIRVVLIDPLHQLPLTDFCIKPFTLIAKNWSDSLVVNAKAELFANVHSFTKSAWEPLVDIMELGLTVTGDAIEIFSNTVADIEVTPETIELVRDIQNYFAGSSQETFQRKYEDDGAPYRLRNETGFPITVWSDSSGKNTSRRKINNGQQISWSFHDWRQLRENLNATDQDNRFGIEIHADGYENLRSIPVNAVGEHLYVTKHNGNKVRIVFDVWIENHLKYISIRSTCVLRNHTDTSLEILMKNKTGEEILLLEPHSVKPLPLNYVDSTLLVRRLGDEHWADKDIYWKSLLSTERVTLKCASDYALAVHPEIPDDPLSKHYPFLFINISVPFQIVNNLPMDVDLRLYSRDSRAESHRKLSKAGRALIYDYNEENLLLMRVDLEGYTSNKFAIINTGSRFSHEFHNEDYVEVSSSHQRLHLSIDYVDLPQGEGRVIIIYAPYVIVNSTGLEFMVSGHMNRVICEPETVTLWSTTGLNGNVHQKITLATKSTHASSPVSLNASGSSSEMSLMSKDRQRELFFGVSIGPGSGRYVNTKVVTVSPRFILCNSLERPLEFREPGGRSSLFAAPGERVSVKFLQIMAGKEICVKYADSERAEWSSGFAMANVGKTYVRMIDRGKATVLAMVEVILEGATFFVHLNKAKSWPFSIRNFTEREFVFYQTDPLVDEDGAELLNHSKDDFKPLRYRLPPRSAMPYSWDFPAAQVKQLVLEPVEDSDAPGQAPSLPSRPPNRPASSSASVAESFTSSYSASGSTVNTSNTAASRPRAPRGSRKVRRRKIQLAEMGELPPANFGGGVVVDLSVIADGPQQALIIAPYNPDASNYDARTNHVKSEAIAEVEAVDSQSGRMLYLNLNGIGISCITGDSRELVYVTLRNIKVNYHVSDALETIALQIQWIQFDNSLAGSTDFPVVVYPTLLPKAAAELAAHPTFSASLTRVRDDSFGVAYIKHATLLLQEMTIEADEDFLLGVVELVVSLLTSNGVSGPHNRPYMPILDDNSILCGDQIKIPEPSGDSTPDIYFEQLHLQPVQLNLSFVRTGSLSSSAIFKDNNAAGNLAFIIDALTLTIGNVNDAPLRFNALLVDNVRTQMANLTRMIQIHYQQEFLYQLHKVLGSADIIGNPVGLFNNISSGVMDLFYEPYLGYTLNDRPQEFGIGLAKGGLSFMKKSVFGVSDSISKVTGSLSKGLSAVTMDQRYQNQRRIRRTRNRPRHAVYGVKYGFESLYESLSSGVMGLAEKPMQGAITDGGAGFFRGLGRGLLGLPTKTTIGLLDMASNITEGIRNTTTVFDTHEIRRVRLPRVIYSDGVVRPYNVRESVGQMILQMVKDGRYAKNHYLAHSNITRNKVVVVSLELVMVASINDMSLEWSLSYDQIQTVTSESTGISLTLVGGAHGPFIPLSDEASRKFIYSSIAKGVDEHNRRQLLEAD